MNMYVQVVSIQMGCNIAQYKYYWSDMEAW